MIQFLSPGYLYGLLILSIPVIIHLFNFRRYKKVLFTNVRYLQELKEETTRTSRLKHLLVLLMRLLAFSFLVFAFAQPVIPAGQAARRTPDEPVSIYIDNSFSMDAVSSQGTLLEVATRKASEIALSFPPSTRFQLLTNDFEAFRQRLISRDDLVDELGRIRISAHSRKLSEVLLRQKEACRTGGNMNFRSFIISDFQKTTADFMSVSPDSQHAVGLIALPVQPTANLYIDTCWLTSPMVQLGRPAELKVRIKNSGEKDAENVPVRFLINKAQRAVAAVAVQAGLSTELVFSFTVQEPGWQKAEIRLTDHPVSFDDAYFFAFEVKAKLQVTSIQDGPASPYLNALFNKDPFFTFSNVSAGQVDYSTFARQDLILVSGLRQWSSGLSDELKKYMESGGTVTVFPDSAAEMADYNRFFTAVGGDLLAGINESEDKVTTIELRHPLFFEVFDQVKVNDEKVDYPSARKHFGFSSSSLSKRKTLMKLQGGGDFLSEYPVGKGTLYVFSVPLEPGFSNLSRHALFVPVVYRMAILASRPLAFANTIGNAQPVVVNSTGPSGDETFHLISKDLNTDIIPAARVISSGLLIDVADQISKAGHFDLTKGGTSVAVLAYNYDR
ncbi:MAG: BatA domain-containing protein, partial [Bacteroidia bacterium]|nr:BatA domain-containing protein [Bacteroidia bacterium]